MLTIKHKLIFGIFLGTAIFFSFFIYHQVFAGTCNGGSAASMMGGCAFDSEGVEYCGSNLSSFFCDTAAGYTCQDVLPGIVCGGFPCSIAQSCVPPTIPSCVPNVGEGCFLANQCGVETSGHVTCSGGCDAAIPPAPNCNLGALPFPGCDPTYPFAAGPCRYPNFDTWDGCKMGTINTCTGVCDFSFSYGDGTACEGNGGEFGIFGHCQGGVCVSGSPPPPTNGQCGSNATPPSPDYPSGTLNYPSIQPSAFCTRGTSNPVSPAFPAQGATVNWTCVGSGAGHTDAPCHATRQALPGGNVAVCDNAWRAVPGNRLTPSQPVLTSIGVALNTQYRDSIGLVARGTDNIIYYQNCNFLGTNNCTWTGSWAGVGGSTNYSPLTFTGAAWDLGHLSATNHIMHNINWSSGWTGWADLGFDNGAWSWGKPFRAQDKTGRWWQIRKNADQSISYNCGPAQTCVNLPFKSGNSNFFPASVAPSSAVTVYCDYNVRGTDSMSASIAGPGASCTFDSFTLGTQAKFNCIAPNTAGNYAVSCGTQAGTPDNVCAGSNIVPGGNLSVVAPVVTVNISASPTNIVWNGNTTVSWSSTNATSCTISPPGWTGLSGNQVITGLTSSVTYTASCLPGPVTASVLVTVQAQPRYDLNVIKSGQGRVASNPAGIDCGAGCSSQSANFLQGSTVTLTAVPLTAGRVFTGWSGACSGTGVCSVVINSDKTVIANFAIDPNFKEF